METQLYSLSKIFTERLFRIPDYQRGYAWQDRQLKDFWNDILQLEEGRNHYTGVLTLERVDASTYQKWDEDTWIIESKSYKPFYIVDGQQRLTTVIILIQALLEKIPQNTSLNYSTREEIQKKYVFDSRDPGVSRSYIFGYESDNPSYEFLKTQIFQEHSSTSSDLKETAYTTNLQNAKIFFSKRLSTQDISDLGVLFKKVTQHLLFNIFTIEEDVDVFVAFETMNNRGKPLSFLELLKNRLIYLSLKLQCDGNEKKTLRKRVNDCWKTVYHQLGRNKDAPLDDDDFLRSHLIFQYPRSVSPDEDSNAIISRRYYHDTDISQYLLSQKFITKNIRSDKTDPNHVSLAEFHSYISSLQVCAENWYFIHNPTSPGSPFHQDEQIWLDKLSRLRRWSSPTLILTVLQKEKDSAKRIVLYKSIERTLFTSGLLNHFYYGENLVQITVEIAKGKMSTADAANHLATSIEQMLRGDEFLKRVTTSFRNNGFYEWEGIRYFLFEYNLYLQSRSKTERRKIYWPEFNEVRSDFSTVEHILPQTAARRDWPSFDSFTPKQKNQLCNSLGNLLPLSKPKNSSLQNGPFREKVKGGTEYVGYQFGSYAENEVALRNDWGPHDILERGLKLLNFLEERWSIKLGDDTAKQKMLGLEFL